MGDKLNRIAAEVLRAKQDAPYYKKYRPVMLRALGGLLHPEPVAEAWYAADCPRHMHRLPGITRRVQTQWRLACYLRGAASA